MVLGIPNFISVGFAVVFVALIARMMPGGKRTILLQAGEVVSGFISVFTSAAIAKIARTDGAFCFLAIAVGWFLIHFIQLNRLNTFCRVSAGVLLGCLCDLVVRG